MIIKLFKITTRELWTFSNKEAFRQFVKKETDSFISSNTTIDEMINMLPRREWSRISPKKRKER